MENLTDEKLYELCKMYGARALEWRRKFIGLLPEVERRKLYEKKGFVSVFEFAAKMAGVSREQVQRVLQLDRKFDDKPILKDALINGEISANKLAKIAAIATVENQDILLNQSKILNCRALETLARDVRNEHESGGRMRRESGNQNGLFETKIEDESVHVNTLAKVENLAKLNLSDEVVEKLLELKDRGLDLNELILEFLEKREKEIEGKKLEIAREMEGAVSRHIPTKVKKVIRDEYGTKCALTNCKKSAEALHHTARFCLTKEHNPYFMAPLCREHHEIAHSIDLKVFERKGR